MNNQPTITVRLPLSPALLSLFFILSFSFLESFWPISLTLIRLFIPYFSGFWSTAPSSILFKLVFGISGPPRNLSSSSATIFMRRIGSSIWIREGLQLNVERGLTQQARLYWLKVILLYYYYYDVHSLYRQLGRRPYLNGLIFVPNLLTRLCLSYLVLFCRRRGSYREPCRVCSA